MDLIEQTLFCNVVEELALDGKGPAGQRDLGLALLADAVDMVPKETGDMRGVRRRGDGDDVVCFRDFVGSGEDRSSAEAVADQDCRCFTRLPQMIRGADEIGDIGGERRVGELALAGAEPGEIEAQHREALYAERRRDALR